MMGKEEEKKRKWNRNSGLFFLFFSLFPPLPFLLSPSFISSLSFPLWDFSSANSRTLPGTAKITYLLSIMLSQITNFSSQRKIQISSTLVISPAQNNQPHSGEQGKDWQRPTPCFKGHNPETRMHPRRPQHNQSHGHVYVAIVLWSFPYQRIVY